jgi:lipopolysaccharide/colanic/teichoic acid biosynthesis glycosyltransferase
MQVETLQNVPKSEKKQYLRVATISNKTALCFFYIGNDIKSLQFLTESFQTGLAAENIAGAKQMLRPQSAAEIDLIIIDVAYNAKEMRDFQSFLHNRKLQGIPVIYNQHFLQNNEYIKDCELIDDVIDLNNWQFDFSSKVSFLKKSKEYSHPNVRTAVRIQPSKPVMKRIFDILVSTVLLVMAIPLFLVIAIAIRLESRGPIFYTSKRAGRGFRIFKFFKFRTMEVNADKKIESLAHLNQYADGLKGARFFKINNDPRITRVGRFLRNTSLDELPQLFNVLKGDMSLVGNRPLPLYEAATLTTNEFVERFMAPAGITGLWQIKKRGKSDMSTEERISLDISYARNSTLLYDLWIMANTPKALLQKTDV